MSEIIHDPALEFYIENELEIARVMTDAVSRHAEIGSDKFSVLEHDPAENPYQRADCVAALGKAATQHEMMRLAPLVYPEFGDVVDRLIDQRPDMLSASAGALEHGEDITVSTGHRQIVGVAVIACAYVAALYESGEVNHGDIDTEIIASLMLKYTNVIGVPATPLLQEVFTATRFVVPAANRTNKGRLPAGYAADFNRASVENRHAKEGRPRVTAVAMSATGDAYSSTKTIGRNRRDKGYYLAPPTDGTAEEYAIGNYVLPADIDLHEKDAFFVGKLHRASQITDKSDVQLIMQEIAAGITSVSKTRSIFVPDMDEFQRIKSNIEASRIERLRRNS